MLRGSGSAYLRRYPRTPELKRRVLAEAAACRTPSMGWHESYCDACGEVFTTYNSCRNRNCPTCSGPARARWLERMLTDVLPVTYFMIVFTLPQQLRRLVLANQAVLYKLLFSAAWRSLKELAADAKYLGGVTGMLAVLHTWKHTLEQHPHLHCVVPGGVLSDDGQWIAVSHGKKSGPAFLLPVRVLSALFRGKFLDGLKRLHRQGKWKLPGPLSELADRRAFEQWLAPLYQTKWQVYSQGPPRDCRDPSAMLKYLARYIVGGPISDKRLISHEGAQVTFWARQGSGKQRQRRPLSLSGVQFTHRWLLHVLPRGFHRVRYFGLFSNRQRGTRIPRLREAIAASRAPTTVTVAEERASASDDAEPAPPTGNSTEAGLTCPACGVGRLQGLSSEPAPTWRLLLARSPFALVRGTDYEDSS